MTPQERTDRAKALLEDPIFQEAINVVREKYRDLIEETPVSDDGALLDIRKMLRLLRDVEEHIKTAAESGALMLHNEEQRERPFLQDIGRLWNRANSQ